MPVVLILNSLLEVEDKILEHELQTTTKFITHKVSNSKHLNIRIEDVTSLDGHKVQWKDTQANNGPEICFDGIPYINIGWMTKDCQNGPDRHKKKKAKYKEEKEKDKADHGYIKKTRRHIQDTKKLDCPARIRLRIIVKFPQFKVDNYEDKYGRKQSSLNLKSQITNDLNIEKQLQFHLLLPDRNEHQNHLLDELAGFCQPVDSKIILKIKQLTIEEGVRTVQEMKRHIRMFVSRDLCPGQQIDQCNRRYYPHDRDIKNHIDRALSCTRYSKDDQENLEFIVDEWKKKFPDDSFHLRTSYQQENDNSTDFLFVQQTSWQKRLMSLYGNDIAIMDATYKTSNYSLPLFFICVQTNIGHSIVASFITATESQSAVREALEIVKKWNINWKPQFFMTDYDNREIDAIEGLFEGCIVYLCSFHREQAWRRWTRDHKHGVGSYQDEMINLFRQIALSTTVQQCEIAIDNLKSHQHWKENKSIRYWFEHFWLSEKKRWVRAFKEESYNIRITTTNGLERKHRDLKKTYLVQFSEGSISSLAVTLVNEFLKDSYKMYKSYNVQSLDICRRYHNEIPDFLHNKPKMFIEHCLQRLPPNVNTIPSTNFSQENGIMKVESVDSNNTYIIEVSTEPKCSCKDWFNTHLPCKHLLGMFIAVEGFSWDDMPNNYTTCPHFNLDPHLKQQAMASVKQSSSTNHLDNLSQCNLECVVDPEEKMEVESLINKPNDGRAIGSGNNLKKSLAVLKDIQNSLFLIRNHTDLSDIYTQLQAIQSHINSKIPCEAGLPTLTTTKPAKRARTFINLPQRKKFIPTKKATEKPLNIPKDVIVEGTFDLPIDLCREENETLLENLEPSSLTDSERVVNTIWNSGTSGSKDYLLSKVGPFNIMDTSILFLKSLLPDEIIDAYIYLLTATRQDKKVFHIPSACASAIVLGQHDLHGYLVDEDLSNYNILIGAINESRNHWTLLAVYPMEKVMLYINPLGETDARVRDIERKWRYFVEGRNNEGLADLSGNWEIQTVNHERQKDSTSCGIYVIKFAESLISGEDLIFNDEQGFLQDVRYGIAKQLLEVSDSLVGTCRACQNTATLTGVVIWVNCVTCEKSFHAVCVYTSSNLGSDNSVFQCYLCVRLKKNQPSVSNSYLIEDVVPKRKMRRPRLKNIPTNEDTMQLSSTAINSSHHNTHWLFLGTNAQTAITQTLISGMCGYTLDEVDLLIKGSKTVVGGETVAQMFENYVKAGLKEVMEIRNGCTEYHSPHWRHIRFVNNIPLVHHMEMRNDADGMGRRLDVFVNDSDRELNALILEAFGVFKLKQKSYPNLFCRRVGYPHGYFLTVKMTENEKLLQNLEDVMGQNLNRGWNYFSDVLMMEAQIIMYSKMKNISLKEADKWLFPCKHISS